MADETVLNCSLEWSGLKVGCNACITTHRLDYEDLEAHDDFSSYFQCLTFMCTSEKLMPYPPAQDTRKVKNVRKAGLLFEIPFAEIQEIGNCWPAQCRLPDSPFRTTPIRLLRCKPAYVVLKSGRVLVLEQSVSTGGTDLFWKAVCKLVTAFADWKEKEQRDSKPTWESVAMFFTKLFRQEVTVSARERAKDCFTNFRIPLSKEGAVAAAVEERRLMGIALRWLRRTERASVQEEKYRRFFRFLRRPVTPLTPTDAPYKKNMHSDWSSKASGVNDDDDFFSVVSRGFSEDAHDLESSAAQYCTHNEYPQGKCYATYTLLHMSLTLSWDAGADPPSQDAPPSDSSTGFTNTLAAEDHNTCPLPQKWVILQFEGDLENPMPSQIEKEDMPGRRYLYWSPPEW